MAKQKSNKKKEKNEPTLEQWKALYDTAQEIRKMEPWNDLWDTYLITVKLPERQDPIYCSVMGKNGECFAVGLYYDKESIASFNSIMDFHSEDDPFCITAYEQKCLMCYFGDKEELYPKDKEVLKNLNLSFRGQNEWIYFRALDPGYAPWFINSEQADILIHTLQIFIKACDYLKNETPDIDFENEETLVCSYSKDNKDLIFKKDILPIEDFELEYLEFDNIEIFSELKKQKKNNIDLEFEFTYVPMPIQENKNTRPFMPKIVLLMDRKTGIILDQTIADKNEGYELTVLVFLTKYIMNNGRPSAIYVRDFRTGRYIEDFCKKVGIELIMDEGVPAVDEFLFEMLENFG